MFLKTPICFPFLTSGLRLFHSFIQYWKNVLLKVFVLDRIGFILMVDANLEGKFSSEGNFRYEQ